MSGLATGLAKTLAWERPPNPHISNKKSQEEFTNSPKMSKKGLGVCPRRGFLQVRSAFLTSVHGAAALDMIFQPSVASRSSTKKSVYTVLPTAGMGEAVDGGNVICTSTNKASRMSIENPRTNPQIA
eukprot:426686-Amphidinium_carterae.1